MTPPRFIVAELSKNWEAPEPGQTPPPPALLAHAFEQLLNINFKRGYRLSTWQLHRILTVSGNELNETIIAVFERVPRPAKSRFDADMRAARAAGEDFEEEAV